MQIDLTPDVDFSDEEPDGEGVSPQLFNKVWRRLEEKIEQRVQQKLMEQYVPQASTDGDAQPPSTRIEAPPKPNDMQSTTSKIPTAEGNLRSNPLAKSNPLVW